MVLSSRNPTRTKKTRALGIPTVNLSMERSALSRSIVEACEEYGFFMVVNHGISKRVIRRAEKEGEDFFTKPASEKQKAGPPDPFGYGCKKIGSHGDMGELEYLLFQASPRAIAQRSKSFSDDPSRFSCAVNDYVEAVKDLACRLLDLIGEELLGTQPATPLSRLVSDVHGDSCFRVNHYPPAVGPPHGHGPHLHPCASRVGFGEHSDPQILTVLRSNDVGGLQICTHEGLWIPVPPDPAVFYAFVGDALQTLTNERFMSVRHRVMANTSSKPRMSMVYFGAPALTASISPIPEMVSPQNPNRYKNFTWGQYKMAAYSLRLGDHRIDLFKNLQSSSGSNVTTDFPSN